MDRDLPEKPESHNSLGAVLAETGQVSEAEAEFRGGLKIRPTLPASHARRAYMLANRGNLDEAVWHFERAGDGAVNQFSDGITLARMNRLGGLGFIWKNRLQRMRIKPVAGLAALGESCGRGGRLCRERLGD